MSLYQRWANKEGIREPINGSWLQALRENYGGRPSGDDLRSIAIEVGADLRTYPVVIQAIAIALGATRPSNGSWLQAIIDL